jgi:hypothetical protein
MYLSKDGMAAQNSPCKSGSMAILQSSSYCHLRRASLVSLVIVSFRTRLYRQLVF